MLIVQYFSSYDNAYRYKGQKRVQLVKKVATVWFTFDFSRLSKTKVWFHDFPDLENLNFNLHDFPGSVLILTRTQTKANETKAGFRNLISNRV